ncbi:F0F1 ATP synthase subunit gamma [Roseovarius sp. SCSIO 43702]|uniref:F0F1 ATP synthase subunit gamma n=1 Tax=Roseovarius sp. SCSIO 43702 TaxID=2823043 RepID=UPI001C730CD7|nr:FoF1 ATP synthase subunit gamma [Roseovarius sp. SCSIO 43702]QYX55963.1 F0F1 ATP synthase subunit gamma [Roseovarius sp. SCSIO 43702]
MAQTLERLTRRTATMKSIRGIVRTMKTMSAINAAPYEQAAEAIDAWRETVLDGLHGFLRCNGPIVQAATDRSERVLIVLGSDHGLCGNYNELLAREVAAHPHAATARVICVGAQMEDALGGEGVTPAVTLLPPANVDGLIRLAGQLVTRLDTLRAEAGPGDLAATLIYTQRGAHGLQAPVTQTLLPLDPRMLDDLAQRPWVSRSLPRFSMPAADLLAALVRNLVFATLYRAAAEALVTENAARLARMQQAEQSVDENLEELEGETRSVRQSEITTELLDVIVGFEALKGREKRRRRGDASRRR